MDQSPSVPTRGRRAFLLGAGAMLVTACTDSDPSDTAGPADPTTSSAPAAATEAPAAETATVEDDTGSDLETLTPAMFESLSVCALTSAAAAGPFPSRELLERRDITEDYPGHPLRLGIRVVDEECRSLSGADVEIWHTDASGDYSSYDDDGTGKDEGEGTTFCRGLQIADGDGILEFQTIYPGWYEGRAVHIHATVRIDGEMVLTAQLYFDESYTEAVYATGEYAQYGLPDTTWSNDGLIGDPAADGSLIALTAAQTSIGSGTLGLVNLGVA